ncbi:hypothetical protein GpartN1_g3741.t1 [Galdieria partita]|uniref:Uncharacterized protein n=1 Tax=Galdieria partita TaxID=83374 RepID=A0A9C7UQT4_9RHOD|nr:hypothetical protein GpartN1_g3741.t1 [Galdieria partita]
MTHLDQKHFRLSTKKNKQTYFLIGVRTICILYLSLYPLLRTNTLKETKAKVDPSYWNVYHSVEQLASKLEVWEHKDLINFPICRLERVCRTDKGLWILPKWLSNYQSWLEKCGLNQSMVWYADIQDPIHFHNSSFQGDLIGTQVLRWQLPHLIADTIWILLWRHFIYYSENTKLKPWSFTCVNSASKPCITTLFWSDLEPVLFNNPRPREEDWTSIYLEQVLFRTIPTQWKAVSADYQGCFQSVTFSRIRPGHIPNNLFSEQGTFFEENGISREDRLKSSFQDAKDTGGCIVTIALKNNSVDYPTNRLANSSHPNLFEQIANQIPRLAFDSTPEIYRPNIYIRLVDFQTITLDDWNSAKESLQEVDVVVTDHSIANSQFLLLRPNTTVIEVLPFSYSAVMFKELAFSLGLDYHSVSSNPDEETFLSCLFAYEQDQHSVSQLAQAYRKEAEKWRLGIYQQSLHLDKLETTDKVRMSRHCARQQRISANATEIAYFVIQKALTPCLTGLWYHQHAM